MDPIEIFNQWNEVVFKSQKDNALTDLYHVDDASSGSIMSDVLSKKKAIHPIDYSIFKLHDEFIVISKDMKYIGGILFLLRPHINNTEDDDGFYHQRLTDRRYLMYCTFGMEAIYNFWDRIGDMLYHYFPTNIKPGNVYFGRVKDRIEEKYKGSENYKRLMELHGETEAVFNLRHEAVHDFQIETKYYWGNIQHHKDDAERNRLNAEKFTYPEKLKKALEICNEAFFVALKLIDELPDDPEILKLRTDATAKKEAS
jgi:hypothetical protein